MIKDKKHIRNKYKQTRIKYYKTMYNNLNKQIKKLIKEENKTSWQNKCNDLELEDPQKTTWKTLKSIMGTKNKPPHYPTLITNDDQGNIIKSTTTTEKINTFTQTIQKLFTEEENTEFNDKYKKEVEKVINNNQHIINPLKITPINYKTSANSISKETIRNTVNTLKTNKAPGPDNISNKIIKYLIPYIIYILHNLFNLCWHKGYYPKEWKRPLSLIINKPLKNNPIHLTTVYWP